MIWLSIIRLPDPITHGVSARRVNGDRLSGCTLTSEFDRLKARRANLDLVHARFEVQMLDRAVEVLGHPDVVTVREICASRGAPWIRTPP